MLNGNGGNDALYSNAYGTSVLIGSSNLSTDNKEIDVLVGSSTAQDHFVLSGRYRGSGYAVIRGLQVETDFLYLTRGSGGESVRTNTWDSSTGTWKSGSFATGLKISLGSFNDGGISQMSTFISTGSGDLLAVLVNRDETLQHLYNAGCLRFSA